MAKIVKAGDKYGLILDQEELDFIAAITDVVGGDHKNKVDYSVWEAVHPYSKKDWSNFFDENVKKGYPTFKKE